MSPEIGDLSASGVALTASSPGYHTDYPDIRNAALIPGDVAAMMAPTFLTRFAPPREVSFHRVHDVYVVGEGLVLNRDLSVVPWSRTQYIDSEIEALRDQVRQAVAAGQVIEDSGTTLLLQKRGMENFGHWMIELLPIAHLALPHLQSGAWSVLASVVDGGIENIALRSLEVLGVPTASIRQSKGAPRHVPELVLAHNLTEHGCYISPLVMGCMDHLMRQVTPAPPQPLWISRRGLLRTLWNEPELEAVLSTLGWRILDLERLPLLEQIAAFKSATRVAGVSGAGLTGIVYAPPGTPVTAFAPARMPDTFFWLLSGLRGHRYVEVRAPHDISRRSPAPWDWALVLSLPEVLAHLG